MSKIILEDSEVASAAHNLHDLLDVICDVQFEASEIGTDRRVDSLLWIARDLSKGIIDQMGASS
jgi:hypothetical protein